MKYGPRLDSPGSTHHVMCRAVDGCTPFNNMENSAIFMDCLGKSVEKTALSVLAWAIMPNHVHLLVKCGPSSLSASMQSVLVRFAMIYNKMNRRRGHLFQGKFRSILVEDGRYVLELIRYIHLNPIRAGMVGTLDQLARYPLTGHRGVVSKKPEQWHDVDGLMALLSDGSIDPLRAYEWLLNSRHWRDDEGSMEYVAGNWLLGKAGLVEMSGDTLSSRRYECWGAILGSREFAVDMVKNLANQNRHLVRNRTPMDGKLFGICQYLRITQGSLVSPSKASNVLKARRLAVRYFIDQVGYTISETARVFRHTPSAMSKTLLKARESIFDIEYLKMCNELGPDVKTDLEG